MTVVQLQDGTKVNFAKTPTPQEVDFAFQKIQAERARSAQTTEINTPAPETVVEKVADFTGGKKIAQGIGQAIANTEISKQLDETQKMQSDTMTNLINRIKEKKAKGEDPSRLQNALEILVEDVKSTGNDAETLLNQNHITGKQVLGDALQLATTIGTAGTYGAEAKTAETGALMAAKKTIPTAVETTAAKTGGFWAGLGKGALKGAATGSGVGAVQGVAQGLQDNQDINGIVESGLKGATTGLVTGGVVGGVVGGITGGIKGKQVNDAIIKAQEESGIRPTLDKTIIEKTKVNPEFGALVKEAQKQGYTEKDINFLSTVSEKDKPILKKMFDVTAKAQVDPRQTVRAADILGDNATGIVKQVESQNKEFGKAVDATAKGLKGKLVDASPVRDKALTLLESAGVTANEDGTPNWSKSIFSKTPELQARLMKSLSDLPAGQMDAYDLHNFKKSIDEVVEFGTNGEGFKGKAENILKGIRREADGVLDSNFPDYNAANTEFKNTRDVLDEVRDVVGTKVDFSSKASGQSFGQRFRSAFSNNTSRGRTLQLIETLQNVAKSRKLKGAEKNLLDQALYVNMLEDKFGSQASTGLASEVRKGVEAVKKGVEAFRDPIKGVGNLAVDLYEKGKGVSDTAKKDLLQKFLK